MMEHIRQYDWYSSDPEQELNFLLERDIDNSVTERILHNTFRDPLISSDSEDEQPQQIIDWDNIFKRKDQEGKLHKVYVPGLRGIPPFPKISALTQPQQFQCIKVICQDNPNVLPLLYLPRPSAYDRRVFEELKDTYFKEQKEYLEWAKNLWTSNHCIRALRPKPILETVYEAEYKMKANEMASFPKRFEMAALISLLNPQNNCTFEHEKDLININFNDLPLIEIPDPITKKFIIMRPCPVPEPCDKHPCWFVLPYEKQMSVLPLTEIHRELAQFALENDTQFIASEGALKCLVEFDRHWSMPISVCQVINADGDKKNIIVFGSEFSSHKKSAMSRTYRAFRHLLEYALIPAAEKARLLERESSPEQDRILEKDMQQNSLEDVRFSDDDASDEDDGHLFIDEDCLKASDSESDKESEKVPAKKSKIEQTTKKEERKKNLRKRAKEEPNKSDQKQENKDEFYNCCCKDSTFEHPPPRSFIKWRLKNPKSEELHNLIVHCSHKIRNQTGEVIAEPIPEYQIDIGGSEQSEDKIRSLALSLFLRKNASLINVRVDCASGEVVTIDNINQEQLHKKHPNLTRDISNILFESLHQLQGLLPGQYILQHEPSHGANAFLFAPKIKNEGQIIELDFSCTVADVSDEAKDVKTAPVLTPVLLPYHKFRKILPLAFTPHQAQVAKEPKKKTLRQKTPPQAIKWPKKKNNKKKKNNNRF